MKQAGLELGSFSTFGELLKYLRRRARMTQRELGIAVGYSETYITRLEGDSRLPDPNTVRERFVEALNLQDEPETIERLIRLAKAGREKDPTEPVISATTHTTRSKTNLQEQLTPFVGREHEQAMLVELLERNRLVTLTGSGGVGKTRLAIEVGASFVGAMHRSQAVAYRGSAGGASPLPDGVWLVDLAPLADGVLVAGAVMAILGLQALSRPPLSVLIDYLRDKRLLLILDNCEHLIQPCAELVEALLSACPQLHILATSREWLNVPGETAWRVPSLQADEAVRLFVERARAARPDFALTPDNGKKVAQICQRLDDIPLAIELAAARLRALSLEQIAARLSDVFRVLTGGSRTALPRHQTLHALIDWSYGLLPAEECALLRGLSVFAGGWTLEAAEAVFGANVLEQLNQLVNKSLVVAGVDAGVDAGVNADADKTPGGTRYHLLETVRQYASRLLQQTDVTGSERARVSHSHLEYFANLAQAGMVNVEGGIWHWVWNGVVATELDNTRAALNWAAQAGEWSLGWRLITGVLGVWTVLGHGDELTRWMETIVLSNPAASDAVRSNTLAMLGRMKDDRGDIPGSLECYRLASVLAHQLADEELILETDQYLGFLTPDVEQAIRLLSGVVRLARESGRKTRAAWALGQLSARMRMQGDYRQASVAIAESVGLARETGDPGVIAITLMYQNRLCLELGEPERARVAIEECVALARQRGLQGTLGVILADVAEVGLSLGDYALVRQALQEHIHLHYRMDYLERVAQGFASAAGLAQLRGQLEQAARLLGAASAIRREHHSQGIFESELFAAYERRLPALRAALAPADFEPAWAAGQTLSLQQAIAEALAV